MSNTLKKENNQEWVNESINQIKIIVSCIYYYAKPELIQTFQGQREVWGSLDNKQQKTNYSNIFHIHVFV